jgi:pilus assembly protein Flp/PilA
MNQYIEYVVAWMNVKFGVDLTAEKEEGQGLVEYALIIALVAIACIAALGVLKDGITGVFSSISTSLSGAV